MFCSIYFRCEHQDRVGVIINPKSRTEQSTEEMEFLLMNYVYLNQVFEQVNIKEYHLQTLNKKSQHKIQICINHYGGKNNHLMLIRINIFISSPNQDRRIHLDPFVLVHLTEHGDLPDQKLQQNQYRSRQLGSGLRKH